MAISATFDITCFITIISFIDILLHIIHTLIKVVHSPTNLLCQSSFNHVEIFSYDFPNSLYSEKILLPFNFSVVCAVINVTYTASTILINRPTNCVS